MKKTIWKYVLTPEMLAISIPEGATIRTVRGQGNDICIWAEVYPDAPLEVRNFEVFGTGHTIPVGMFIDRKYIGTAAVCDESLIFHVYERIN